MDQSDPIIDEIHDFRAQHAAKFGYDVKSIVADFIRQQDEAKALGKKFINTPGKRCKPGLRYTSMEEDIPSIAPPIKMLPLTPEEVPVAKPL